jgi:hypothetical protein
MGHLINPITYRLGKTKFWNFIWVNKTKKNYKNFLVEDLNFYKFSKWLFSILSWHKIGVFIHDFKVVKRYNSLDFCLFFFLKKLNLFSVYKKTFFNFFIRDSFVNFFNHFLISKKTRKLHSFMHSTSKVNKIIHANKLILQIKNKKKVFYKKKKLLKLFLKQNFGAKKRKKNKKRLWLNNYITNYCFFSLKKGKEYKKRFLKTFNYYFLLKSFGAKRFFLNNAYYKGNYNDFLLQKNFLSRVFNYGFFFRILNFFLSFFLKKIFNNKKITFNFFQKKTYFLNAKTIKKYVRFNLLNTRSKVTQTVKKVFRKTKKKYFILGLKIGFFGRYEKKLRNKSVWQIRGSLSPSNINTPITHKNFCILLKQGLCGVKVSFLNKLKKNEIFKKKTFINKTFEFK